MMVWALNWTLRFYHINIGLFLFKQGLSSQSILCWAIFLAILSQLSLLTLRHKLKRRIKINSMFLSVALRPLKRRQNRCFAVYIRRDMQSFSILLFKEDSWNMSVAKSCFHDISSEKVGKLREWGWASFAVDCFIAEKLAVLKQFWIKDEERQATDKVRSVSYQTGMINTICCCIVCVWYLNCK